MASWIAARFPSPFNPAKTQTFKEHFGTPIVTKLDSPLTLFWKDVLNIVIHLHLLPGVLRPFFTTTPTDELYPFPPQGISLWWWTAASLVQLPLVLTIFVVGLLAISVIQLLTTIHDLIFWDIIQGPELQVYPSNLPSTGYNPKHRWVFLNGIAVSGQGLHANLKVLSETFHAPVLGVHNRTYGLLGDLVECIFQRSFGYRTLDTRLAVPILKRFLEADEAAVERVILVAHSQGGICASHVLEQIYQEVSWDRIKGRLEVYTFGSAALRFENPWVDKEETGRLVEHMEHYCHEEDMVCRFGALSSLKMKDEVYRGKCFVWKGRPGHLLNQHYLKDMFGGVSEVDRPGSFLQGRIERYDGTGGNRWYVTPGVKTIRGEQKVKDVSDLWKYMVGSDARPALNGRKHS